jgi:hypothetical protein
MLGHPQSLVDFLSAVAAHPAASGDTLELVIHGDFVDFLAEEPWSAWTPNGRRMAAYVATPPARCKAFPSVYSRGSSSGGIRTILPSR